jgi:acetylornithine deacetylase
MSDLQNISPSIIQLQNEAIDLLKTLITIPSFSKEEDQTALSIKNYLLQKNIQVHQDKNNIWAYNLHFNAALPTLLLNSHHDTVKPNPGYTFEPFSPFEHQGKIYGLGSNDAGASVVSLLATFLNFYDHTSLPYNLVFVASAEEEISGQNGIEMVLPQLKNVAFGIVGEPTQMEMAIAERGLLVLDIVTAGKSGHAARNEGDNAIIKMLPIMQWFNEYQFSKVSNLLGPVKMTVSVIETENKHHNVVPASCKIVVDIRVNELYSFQEILDTIHQNIQAIVTPRSTRLKSSSIALDHAIVKAGIALGKGYYGSPTSSDKALMPFPTLKMGPGDSARSHTADEYVYIDEIKEGIVTYIQLLEKLFTI